jgi:phosphotransferase system enzyme I (PtsI)
MVTMHGTGVHQRIVMGNLSFFEAPMLDFSNTAVMDTQNEILRFRYAHKQSLKLIQYLYTRALTKTNRSNTKVFQSYLAILEDQLFIETVIKMITEEGMSADCAVVATGKRVAEVFLSIENEYMYSQAIDVQDVAKLIVKNLLYNLTDAPIRKNGIVCAYNLTPSDVIELGCRNVKAIVVAKDSNNSYISSVVRTMCIPTILGVGNDIMDTSYRHKLAIADSFSGTLYIDPNEDTIVNITRMVASNV